MRLVNLAHGDLIVLAAFLILVLVSALGLNPFVAALVAMPLMFAIGWALQFSCSTARSARTSCRRCWSPSACRSSSRTACSKAFPPTAGASPSAGWKPRRVALGPINVGVMPLLTFASAIAVIVGLNQLFYRTVARPRLSRHLGRSGHRRADGHPAEAHLRHRHRHRHGGGDASPRSISARAPISIRPSARRG